MEKVINFDEIYRKTEGFVWGIKPNPLTRKIMKYLPKSAKILDLGCGEGKDALFLARQGFRVIAVDISPAGIEKLVKKATSEGLGIKTNVADLRNYKIKENYNAIISLAAIHFLSRNQVKKIIEAMKRQTKLGGINLITVFRKGDDSGAGGMYYFDDGELKDYYSGWKILMYKEYRKKDKHGKHGKVHYHLNAEIIAKRIK